MAQNIRLKRSATAAKVPLTTDLALGELAINTRDGKMYYKKDVDGTQSVIQVARVIPVTVATAAATAAKTGTTVDTTYTPVTGDFIVVTFTSGNSVATATLSINGSTAQNLRLNNANVNTSTFSLAAGATVTFYYDGSFYHCMGSQDTSDDYDIYSLRTLNIQVGAETTQYKFLMQGTDGKFYPISIGNTTVATKTVATTEFLINSKVIHYYTTATLATDAVSTIFYNEGLCETRYAFNQTTWTLNRPVYLVGTINSNGNFVLDGSSLTSYFTQTLPTTDNGKLYIFVGIPYANTALKLYTNNPIYEYKDGKIRQYVPTHTHAASDITSGTIATARLGSGTANSTTFLRGDNTWQTISGTVTSVALSGGTTGLTVSGSPITTSGTITLAGTLAVANGGTGATTAANARTNLGAAADADVVKLTGNQTIAGVKTFSDPVVASSGYQIGSSAFNAQTTTYTLAATDNGKVITINSSSAVNLTVGTAVGSVGFSCTVIQLGTGQVTIAASSTTLNSYNGLKLAGRHAAATLVCYSTNVFNVAGNLVV